MHSEYMCCGAESWTGSTAEAADSSDLSDRSEQSDVMMIDQLSTQVTSVEADGGQAAAPASVSLALPDAGQSSSSQTPPLPEVNSPAAAGSAAAKPRVFKMSDEFLMFKFKIEMCSRKDRHDWKICPYAHPGEVARRRHPRGYTAVLCPAKTAVSCPRREQCTFAHNPFEFWLHPDRFKTSLCNQGPTCDRPICFFAHKDEEVRRLAHGLEAAGPDDYVYATSATPEPSGGSEPAAAHHPPPPPPPRMSSLGHASSGALQSFLQGSSFVAAAAAAAAAAASLNSGGLLLGPSQAQQHYQQLMMAGGDEALLQAAGSGLMADAASALRPGQQQQGMLKWSSSVLSKRGSGQFGGSSNGGHDALARQASLEAPGGSQAGVVGLLGPAAAAAGSMPGSATAAGSMLSRAGSTGVAPSTTLDQLNGLLQMVHVSSSSAMAGPSGPGY
ncbi:hypothetical protein OEZ86_011579 [Tetradesmus obliquus]|nr:hypothetical protein OEZ86_011579 [Tetradesmus obliquus]